MDVAIDNYDGAAGKNKKQKTKVTLYPDGENMEELLGLYWKLTDRKKVFKNLNEIGPEEFHHWGIKNAISKKSPTLKQLTKINSLNSHLNYKDTFEQILSELNVNYSIEEFKTFNKRDNAVVYEIHSTPTFSFHGLGATEKEAIYNAAKRGLTFLINMSS